MDIFPSVGSIYLWLHLGISKYKYNSNTKVSSVETALIYLPRGKLVHLT